MERHWAKTSLLSRLFFELDADFPKSHLNVLRVGRPSKIYNFSIRCHKYYMLMYYGHDRHV